MISENIKNLFQFIEYLNSNIDNFKQFEELLVHLRRLDNERNDLKPENNFADKIKYDELQSEIGEKFEIIQGCIINPIISKAKELNVCDKNNYFEFNGFDSEINQLKKNFTKDDLTSIEIVINKYIGFRERTNRETFLGLGIFFTDLDQFFKKMFNFFKIEEDNEFIASELIIFEDLSSNDYEKQIKDVCYTFDVPIKLMKEVSHYYNSFCRDIVNNGWVVCNSDNDSVKIYTPELAVILTINELLVINSETKIQTKINRIEYLNTYIEAYKEGERYFENEHKVSPNILYSDKAEQYVRDIHSNFFHIKHQNDFEGWGSVKNQYPEYFTHKIVKNYGFYSGIVNKLEEQIMAHPILFASLDKCEHKLTSKQNETKTEKIITELTKYGFFELDKVRCLSEPNKQILCESIITKGLPYSIALFEFLGFIKQLEKEHFNTKDKLNKEVSKWLNSDRNGRSVKGNISSLSENTTENKSKYTAHLHKENVKIDYKKLK
jgi:hypothetical protein